MYCYAKSEIGNYKNVNQDSVLFLLASANSKDIVFMAVCDGMGGLSNGEKSSSIATQHLNRWFAKILPYIIEEKTKDSFFSLLKKTLNDTIIKIDREISNFCKAQNVQSGTTLCAILIYDNFYYTVNVGDSRSYKITNTGLFQLTKDQTYVQMLVDQGKLKKEDISKHPKRNALIQCVGLGTDLEPIYTKGKTRQGEIFFVCSDGFRHRISEEEIYNSLNPTCIMSDYILEENIQKLIDLNMDRGEKDNISVVCVKLDA